METQSKFKFIVLCVGTILFNSFFWAENLGLNVVLFTLFILASMVKFHPSLLQSKTKLTLAFGLLFSAIQTVLYASDFAAWMYFISILLIPGMILYENIRSFMFAIPTSIFNFILSPFAVLSESRNLSSDNLKVTRFWRFVKLLVIPLVFVMIFFFIFRAANDVFAQITDQFVSAISNFIHSIFKNISFGRIMFLLLGLCITAGFLYRADYLSFERMESKYKDTIIRMRKGRTHAASDLSIFTPQRPNTLNIGLKNEFKSAMMMMLMINFLLFVINLIDIRYVWFGFQYSAGLNLTKLVHEGTYLLIFSILLSISIQTYYFRRNQNFFPKLKSLQLVSYIWILQNIILVISVAIRNYHYIYYFGLAYKRLGVYFFLILVLSGLITVYIKIKNRKSAFYLFRVNLFAFYVFLVGINFIDWDSYICQYNLKNCAVDRLDVRFLMNLSDKTLPLIGQNLDAIKTSIKQKASTANSYPVDEVYKQRIKDFVSKKKSQTIFSWNYKESEALKYVYANQLQ